MSVCGSFRGWRRSETFLRILFFSFILLPGGTLAQEAEVRVRGGFLADSIKIGEPAGYYLSAHYPVNLTVLFPDSTHSFYPFEYQSKAYFATETTDGISADSTVYYLTTFEVDRVQYLRMPVYIVQGGDSTEVSTSADSLLITQLVAHVPDTIPADRLPLKMNTAYEKVSYDFNFWVMVSVIILLTALVVFGWLIFGKTIQRHFRIRRLRRNHAQFSERYNTVLGELKRTFSPPTTESALALWKRYMEQLEAKPYTKLTTSETLRLVREPALTEPMHRIDGAIYGHETAVVDSLEDLKRFADRQFKRKMKEVQHGK